MNVKKSRTSGYIAITTTIVLSLLMLILSITLGSTTLLTRFGTVDFLQKRIGYFVARSCLEYARLQLSTDQNYAGNETRNIDLYQCTISNVETSGQNKIIKSRAQIQGSTTNLKLTVASSDLSTVSLEEVGSF